MLAVDPKHKFGADRDHGCRRIKPERTARSKRLSDRPVIIGERKSSFGRPAIREQTNWARSELPIATALAGGRAPKSISEKLMASKES